MSKAEHLTSSRYRGPEELRNGHITIFFVRKKTIAVIDETFVVAKRKPEKN